MAALDKLPGRPACAGALILFFVCMTWQAGKAGLSDHYVQLADREITRWLTPGNKARGDELARVEQHLSDSLRYWPHNAWALEEMGTNELRRMTAVPDPALAVAAVRSAYDYFRLTLIQRPSSPFAWEKLARSKLYLEELDDEFLAALRHADELGPWEPDVQQAVIFLGLAAWQKLGPAQQAAVIRTLERATLRNAPKVTEIVKSFNRLDLLCAINNSKLKIEEACNRLKKQGPRSNHL